MTLGFLGCIGGANNVQSVASPLLMWPSDYGLQTPDPAPVLPSGMDVFNAVPALVGNPSGPAIAEYTRTGSPDDTITMAGPDFSSSTVFRFFGQTNSQNSIVLERPASVTDGSAASVILPEELPAWSVYVIWPKDNGRYGRPAFINRTDPWWAGPDEAVPGEVVSVFGRNLSRNNGEQDSSIYIKPIGSAIGQWVEPVSVNPYKVDFIAPALPPGAYEVWMHNGHGGGFGWGGPIVLTVISAPVVPTVTFNALTYGAVGNGVADDTAAIQACIDAAAASQPAIALFPAGTYLVNAPLVPKTGVYWQGASRDTSIIVAGPTFAGSVGTALISAVSGSNHYELRGLTIAGNGNLGAKRLLDLQGQDHISIVSSRLNWKGFVFGNPIFTESEYLSISDTDIIGRNTFLGNASQVKLFQNTFRLTDYADAAIISHGGNEVSISGNQIEDYAANPSVSGDMGSGRFFVSQSHPDSNRHLYIADNVTSNLGPVVDIGDNANSGEQVLFECGAAIFSASPTTSTATTTAFASSLPIDGIDYVGQVITTREAMISKGRGVGQTRRVVSVAGGVIVVSPPWSVIPNSSSVIAVGGGQFKSVVYRNTFDGKSNYASHDTAAQALSMYGNVSDAIFANNIVTSLRGGIGSDSSIQYAPASGTISASYFNLIASNSSSFSYYSLYGSTNFLEVSAPGLISHLGNTWRNNTIQDVTLYGIHLNADKGSFGGGDFIQSIYEHNVITNVPKVLRVGHLLSANQEAPINTRFSNIVLYRNVFTSDQADRDAVEVLGSTSSFWSAGNTWTGFNLGSFIELPSGPPTTIV